MYSHYNPRNDKQKQARIAFKYPPKPPMGHGGVAPVVILSDGSEHELAAADTVAWATVAAGNWLRLNHPDHSL